MSTIKERPIIFSGPMIRRILDGHKTQTRRIVKNAPHDWREGYYLGVHKGVHGIHQSVDDEAAEVWRGACRYGKPGDRLWVRESFVVSPDRHPPDDHAWLAYCADDSREEIDGSEIDTGRLRLGKRYPSIHMPRWASRINLEITGVRVDRLNSISEADAIAEGCVDVEEPQSSKFSVPGPLYRYEHLWESINGEGSWGRNEWVWVLDFRRA